MIYEVINNDFGTMIKGTDENGQVWFIPMDPANSDYQRYLASLEEDQAQTATI